MANPIEKINAVGHPNVLATHEKTIEITKEDFLTPTGDCIIGINADKYTGSFRISRPEFVDRLRPFSVRCG
jgi:hypothetical protein